MALRTRDWSVYPVRLRDSDRVQYLRVRADEGAIGLGRSVSVWQEDEWRLARVVDAWADGQGSMLWLDTSTVSLFRWIV